MILELEKRPIFSKMSEKESTDYILAAIDKFRKTKIAAVKLNQLKRKDSAAVDDVMQDFFIYLWQNKNEYDPVKSSYNTYIYYRLISILYTYHYKHNREMEKKRRGKRKNIFVIDEKIDNYEDYQTVFSDVEQDIIRMRFYENLNIKTIADIMDLKPKKVYKILSSLNKKQNLIKEQLNLG